MSLAPGRIVQGSGQVVTVLLGDCSTVAAPHAAVKLRSPRRVVVVRCSSEMRVVFVLGCIVLNCVFYHFLTRIFFTIILFPQDLVFLFNLVTGTHLLTKRSTRSLQYDRMLLLPKSLCVSLLFDLHVVSYWRRGSVVRTSDFNWRTFPDLWLTCDHFVGKVSTMGQPIRPT